MPAGYEFAHWSTRDSSVPSGNREAQDMGDGIFRPKPGQRVAGAGHWRTQATPRSRRADMLKLAHANGWSVEETEQRIAALVESKRATQVACDDSTIAGDVYVPRTKKVRTVRPKASAKGRIDGWSHGVEGDATRATLMKRSRKRDRLKELVREAEVTGIVQYA